MVNTLFAGKVIIVNQVIIMLELNCRRLAEGGVQWLESVLISIFKEQIETTVE